jgi:hypothetical protein
MEPAGMNGASVESAAALADRPGLVGGRPLEEWNAAYAKVESYFLALGVRNKLLLGQLVSRVLDHAIERASQEPDRATMELAAEEMEWVVAEWYSAVLNVPSTQTDPLLSTRGRLALLLADMPGRWQDQFLKPAPWPEEFLRAMRESYLRAGPDFQLSQMDPRPIDFGPIATLTNLGKLAWVRMLFVWLVFAAALVVIFNMTR